MDAVCSYGSQSNEFDISLRGRGYKNFGFLLCNKYKIKKSSDGKNIWGFQS